MRWVADGVFFFVFYRQHRYYRRPCGGLCGILGVSAEESGGWDYRGGEEVLGRWRERARGTWEVRQDEEWIGAWLCWVDG